jgi:hypothetical protein
MGIKMKSEYTTTWIWLLSMSMLDLNTSDNKTYLSEFADTMRSGDVSVDTIIETWRIMFSRRI